MKKLSRKEYDAIEALSQSDLKTILKSPLHFTKRKEMRKETDAMAFGTAFHLAVLEPQEFKRRYIVLPSEIDGKPVNKRLKAHKEWIENYKIENSDKICLDDDDMEKITGMLNSLASHETAMMLLTGGESEVSTTWDYRGHKCKGTIDKWHDKHELFGPTLVELKTARDASSEEFGRETYNRLYDFQLAYYSEAVKPNRVFSVVVETSFPYPIAVYDMEQWLPIGKSRVDKAFDRYEYCQSSGSWNEGYTGSLDLLQPKSWIIAGLKEE